MNGTLSRKRGIWRRFICGNCLHITERRRSIGNPCNARDEYVHNRQRGFYQAQFLLRHLCTHGCLGNDAPRRFLSNPRGTRWFHNLTLTFLNSLIVRLLFPVTSIGVALYSREHNWGIFNISGLPEWAVGLVSVVVLDVTIYAQHVLFHKIPLFWRFHRMHHTDLDIDVTSGARFHPVEIVMSMGIKMAIIVILGAPAWSVLIFEVLLNATSIFNHGNVFMNYRSDKILRIFLVTPDMHRVHHSVIIQETNSNFGFNFSCWDRVLGTSGSAGIRTPGNDCWPCKL